MFSGLASLKQDSSHIDPSPNEKRHQVFLKPGSKYYLPENPNHMDFIVFRLTDSFQTNPTQVHAHKHKLIGQNEPLLVDYDTDFGLRFLGDQTGWVLVRLES